MGCDIHAYIEMWDVPVGGGGTWVSSLAGEWAMGRSYILFGLMAGVRSNIAPPIVAPRGMPNNPYPSSLVFNTYYRKIVDKSPDINSFHYYEYNNSWVLRSDLETELIKYHQKPVIITYEKSEYIEPLNYHTPSWLTLEELLEIRRQYLINSLEDINKPSKSEVMNLRALQMSSGIDSFRIFVGEDDEYMQLNAVIASMLAVSKSKLQTRLTFWFDS